MFNRILSSDGADRNTSNPPIAPGTRENPHIQNVPAGVTSKQAASVIAEPRPAERASSEKPAENKSQKCPAGAVSSQAQDIQIGSQIAHVETARGPDSVNDAEHEPCAHVTEIFYPVSAHQAGPPSRSLHQNEFRRRHVIPRSQTICILSSSICKFANKIDLILDVVFWTLQLRSAVAASNGDARAESINEDS